MRCFVAVDLDEALKPKVLSIQKQIAAIADARIVGPENLHFTLKFLGETAGEEIEKTEEALTKVASGFKPFEISITGLGAFPDISYIRVVWLGAPKLFNLQKSVDGALAVLRPKEKEIVSHLTLARTRSKSERLAEYITANKALETGKMKVENIKLKKSTLTPGGPVYEDVKTFELTAEVP